MYEPSSELWINGVPVDSGVLRTARDAPVVPAPRVGGARHRPGSGAPPRPQRPGWVYVVLAFLTLVALLFGLARCAAAPTGILPGSMTVPTAVIPGAGAAVAPASLAVGALAAGGQSVFDAAQSGDRGLVALSGKTATGHMVTVQSVPADEGFWVGTSKEDRVWVQLSSSGESNVTILPGQLLDLSGPVVPHGADYAAKAGVSAQDGADQLIREGAHLEVDPNRVKVVGTS